MCCVVTPSVFMDSYGNYNIQVRISENNILLHNINLSAKSVNEIVALGALPHSRVVSREFVELP